MPHETLPSYGEGQAEVPMEVAPERAMPPLQTSSSVDSVHTHSSNPSRSLSQHLRQGQDESPARLASTGVPTSAGSDEQEAEAHASMRRDSGNELASPSMSVALPANDGMNTLRRKLHEIREMALSSEEKASRMHALMNADYEQFKVSHILHESTLRDSPGLLPFETSGKTAASTRLRSPSPISIDSLQESSNPYSITDGDLEESYCPSTPISEHGDDLPLDSNDILPELGCQHYKRNVKVQCSDCHRWYPCRLCHDEEVPDHRLERKRIENMLCMFCKTPQLADEYCKHCGELTAAYFCRICKLWDNDVRRRIYHCDECGICRLGEGLGKDYVHCKKCNVCISIAHAERHRCVERATECDCPICGDYMFASAASVVAMQCGHYIHRACYDAYMQTSYRCPICNRSAVNMELQWRKLDHAIEAQPMPEQYRSTKVWITCNDCTGRTCVPYHWLGNKCTECDSYNTNEVRVVNAPGHESEAEEQGQRQGGQEQSSPDVRRPRVSFSQHLTRPRMGSHSVHSPPATTGTAVTTSHTSTTAIAASDAERVTEMDHEEWDASASRTDNDEDDDNDNEDEGDNMSFWGGEASSSAWNLNVSPTSEGGRFFTRSRSWGSPGMLANAVLSRTRSLDAVPQPSHAVDEETVGESLEQSSGSRGWSIGPGWLTSRLQRSSRDISAAAQNEAAVNDAGWLSSAGWTSPTFLAQRFRRGTSISDTGQLNGNVEADDEDEESSDEDDVDDAEQSRSVGGEDELDEDTFGLPGHL